jgi:cytochrome P450
MMHTDHDVYEDPFVFKPERWLDNVTAEMDRNLVPFSKGSRNCLGMK